MAGIEEMKHIITRLQQLSSTIHKICQISGNAGLSLGVLSHGEVIHRANFGYRDVEAELAPDADTVYHLGSLSKASVAAAFGSLVHEGQLAWDTPVKNIYPNFKSTSEEVETQANLVDLLAHRTALASKNAYMSMGHQIHLVPKDQTAETISILEPAGTFRKDFKYSNWMYGMNGIILEEIAGESLGSYTKRKFFEPLGLDRTTFGIPDSENYAQSYCTLDDGTPWHVARPGAYDETSLAGAQGLKSSVNDLLAYFGSFMEAANHQHKDQTSSTPKNPFAETSAMVTPHIEICASPQLQSYGLGLVVTNIPGSLGSMGTNGKELSQMPIVAKSANQTRVWYHNGSLPGAYSSVHILPDMDTVIVVLSNTLALTDVPDYVGQLLIETILDEPNPNDYIAITLQTAEKHLAHYPEMRLRMEAEKPKNTSAKPLEAYLGRYYNSIGTFFIDMSVRGNGLLMTFQGIEEVNLELTHYEDDVFARPNVHRDDDMRAAVFPSWKIPKQKVKFLTGADGDIDRFSWQHDSYLSYGEVFTKGKSKAVANTLEHEAQKPLL